MANQKKQTSKQLLKHYESHSELSDREIQLNILYFQQKQLEKLKEIALNTFILALFLVVIPLLVLIFYLLIGLGF
jgi:heme/copper-type cytochrome/quinol oxidase subunit 2